MNDLNLAQAYAELRKEKEMRQAIAGILLIALEPISFESQLEKTLDTITSLSWLRAEKRGAIFLANNHRELVMAVEHGLDPTITKRCAKVAFGHCLCGRAAAEKRIIFKDRVDEDHDVTYEGMADHGHFQVPIFGKENEVIGILVLYLQAKHECTADELEFLEILGSVLSNTIINRDLQLKAEIKHIQLGKAQLDITEKLVSASEFRDTETGEHIKRMTYYSVVIAQKFGLPEDEIELLRLGAPLHDIGKVGIADEILLKKGPLTDEEFTIMKTHTTIGFDLLTGNHSLIRAGRDIARSHHERWNGRGYPDGLAGNTIPIFGRICALADVFDALTTKRPYKEPWPLEKALDLIRSQSGKQFDPKMVKAFFEGLPEILEIQSRYTGTAFYESDSSRLQVSEMAPGLIQWEDRLSVGIEMIDNQHKYLINLINKLHDAVRDFEVKVMVECLMDLTAYSVVHFSDEEDEMAEMEYPGLSIHRKIHASFVEKVEQLSIDLAVAPMATSMDTVIYLKDWLINHIVAVDADYSQFLADKNQAEQEEPVCEAAPEEELTLV